MITLTFDGWAALTWAAAGLLIAAIALCFFYSVCFIYLKQLKKAASAIRQMHEEIDRAERILSEWREAEIAALPPVE